MGLELLGSLVFVLGGGPFLGEVTVRPENRPPCVGSCQHDGAYLSFSAPSLITGRTLSSDVSQPLVKYSPGLKVSVPLNGPVLSYVSSFQGKGRRVFAKWYARMGRYGPTVHNILESYGLPPELIYVCMIESGFNPDAVSRASAVGLWQFMEVTAKQYGLIRDPWIDERRDPIKATDAAARHLKDLHLKFGDWALAFAAYNAGIGSVNRAIRQTQSNDFWRLASEGALPLEATRYVPKIMAAMLVGRHPGRFGLGEIRRQSEWTFATVSTPGETDLEKMATRTGVSLATIMALNPELLRGFTPPYVDDYPLRVPEGKASIIENYVQKVAFGKPGLVIEHRVRFGERLRHIAKGAGVSHRRLRRLNGLESGVEPSVGDIVLVPKDLEKKNVVQSWVYTEPAIDLSPRGSKPVFFPVRWSMALEQVAEAFHVSVGDLALWNELDPAVPVHRGMALRVWVPNSFDLSSVATIPDSSVTVVAADSQEAQAALSAARKVKHRAIQNRKHVVRRGQNLWTVARKHGVTVDAIAEANGMKKSSALSPGQVLRIPRHVAPKPRGKAAKQKSKLSVRGRRYKVRSGDSLWKISRRFGVPVNKLRRRNGLGKRATLRPGQRLVIPR